MPSVILVTSSFLSKKKSLPSEQANCAAEVAEKSREEDFEKNNQSLPEKARKNKKVAQGLERKKHLLTGKLAKVKAKIAKLRVDADLATKIIGSMEVAGDSKQNALTTKRSASKRSIAQKEEQESTCCSESERKPQDSAKACGQGENPG